MVMYLVVVLPLAHRSWAREPAGRMEIVVDDPQRLGFVTPQDIAYELDSLPSKVAAVPRGDIDARALERRLTALSMVQDATVAFLNDGALRVTVSPMVPVARVFDSTGASYYVSTTGKRIPAQPRYHVDVPVVAADYDDPSRVLSIIPVLDYIKQDPVANALVSSVTVDARGDIILVPVIRGHLINMGDTTMVRDKWDRLKAFYRRVMPVAGWDAYDTLSVKWRGQLVATRRQRPAHEPSLVVQMFTDTLAAEVDVLDLASDTIDASLPQSNV